MQIHTILIIALAIIIITVMGIIIFLPTQSPMPAVTATQTTPTPNESIDLAPAAKTVSGPSRTDPSAGSAIPPTPIKRVQQ